MGEKANSWLMDVILLTFRMKGGRCSSNNRLPLADIPFQSAAQTVGRYPKFSETPIRTNTNYLH